MLLPLFFRKVKGEGAVWMAGLVKVCLYRSNDPMQYSFLYRNRSEKAAAHLIFQSSVRQPPGELRCRRHFFIHPPLCIKKALKDFSLKAHSSNPLLHLQHFLSFPPATHYSRKTAMHVPNLLLLHGPAHW